MINSIRSFFFLSLLVISYTISGQAVYQSLNDNWQFRDTSNRWRPAKVPGTIHTDLMDQNIIPDPYIGTNEGKVQWVEERTWEYQTTFDCTEEVWKEKHHEIVFEGLDTYAFVYLNDSLIITGRDMFVEYRKDVRHLLKKTSNTLRIVFHPASELIKKNKEISGFANYPGGDRVYIRKAQYQFGWDWGPRLVTCGIWKNVRLEGWTKFHLLNVNYKTVRISNDTAYVDVAIMATIDKGKKMAITLSNENTILYSTVIKGKTKNAVISFSIAIPNARLWYCNGYGSPEMYTFTLTASCRKRTEQLITRTGLRTIRFDPYETGGFTFLLNDKRIFVKGANWIPCDNFLPRVSREKYAALVRSAKTSNINLLRVWGGGAYENNAFYELCDSMGIMVWQDLMFACGIYPANSLYFLDLYRTEVEQQAQRLVSHPCVSLFCGNNESDEGWFNWGWQNEYQIHGKDSTTMYNEFQSMFASFPLECPTLHFSKSMYVPTTPTSGWGHKEAYLYGDVHYWGVWWGKEPFSSYDTHVGRFMSEYGFQALPAHSSIRSFDRDGEPGLNDAIMLQHQKFPKGFERISEYMERDYPVPTKLEDYVYVSQVMQRDGIGRAIEAHRRAMPYCMGTIFWQYNDCWPATSWSTVDYYGQPKLLHYKLQELYSPVMISAEERNDSILVYIINEQNVDHKGIVGFQCMSFNGSIVHTSATPVLAKHNTSEMVVAFSKKTMLDTMNAENGFLNLVFSFENEANISTLHYFTNVKSMHLLKDPGLAVDVANVINDDGTYTVTLRTVSLAKNIYLTLDDPNAQFSDNGFDLLPGASIDIYIRTKLSPSELRSKLNVKTMNALIHR